MEDLDDVFLELPLEILLMLPSYLSGAEVRIVKIVWMVVIENLNGELIIKGGS